MKQDNNHKLSGAGRALGWAYILTMVVMGFTGFGQMPIFKRYYISDIPGMGWSSEFYVTLHIHYLGATLLLGLLSYFMFDYFFSGRNRFGLRDSAYLRIVLLGGIVITGVFKVLKNLPDLAFSPGFTIFIDLSHMGFVMAYIFAAIFLLFIRSGWAFAKS